ncbi:MAG: iron ABC transporter permease [Mesorhizobium sp.]|nr:MAG: iron ABC transporter permease [Mesorhizobium sp.]TIP50175.1 MAG: iron ABC transporter permease [Mesorhizobium sp.]TJV70278.1 MAG: iron ABC transporter permease [Mesorhizobium sp.]
MESLSSESRPTAPWALFRSRKLIYAALGLALSGSLLLGVCLGQYPVAPAKVWSIVASPIGLSTSDWTIMDERIVTLLRGPRVLLAAICGAGLAMCGAALQGIFRNPLASPELLGVSSGAAFGGAIAILMGASGLVLIGGAFAAGMLALIIVGAIARAGGRSDITTTILAGVIVGAFFTALVSAVQLFADPQNSLPAIVFWLMGSFATSSWDRLLIAAPAIVCGTIVLWAMRFRINVLSLGEEEAQSLGIPVERDRWLVCGAASLTVGAAVAVAGIVAWVGIVVPHAARLLVGHDHRNVLPTSCLLGAIYLSLMDTLARSLVTAELPLGVITAMIGAPIVAVLLRRMGCVGETG